MATVFVAFRALCYMAAFILFFGWLALRVQPLDERLKVPLPASITVAGVLVGVIGGLIAFACAGVFVMPGTRYAGHLRSAS